MWENTDQKNLENGHFSLSVYYLNNVSSHKNQALIIIQEKTCPNFLKRDSIRVSSEVYFDPGRRFAMEYFRENSKRNPLLMNY